MQKHSVFGAYKMRISIIFFTEQGGRLAEKIRELFRDKKDISEAPTVILYRKTDFPEDKDSDVICVMESLRDWCADVFPSVDALIFIGATGIAVRTIAPCLVSKTKDPAVLVADESGKHMISLLSGHLGGGNALTCFLAEGLGADPVITTASDVGGKLAIDVWAKKNHLCITDFVAAKAVAARIVRGEAVLFYCEGRVRGELPPELRRLDTISRHPSGAIVVSARTCAEDNLHLVPGAVILGIGCKKDKPADEIKAFIFSLLREQKIAPQSIYKIASIDLKAEEAGLLALADEFDVPFVTFSAEELNGLPGEYTASAFVSSVTGVDNVCERAAMASLNGKERENARFLCRKVAGNGVTAALLEREWEVIFE